jgi:hypothetical protein
MEKVDTTLFTKKIGKDLFVLQIYVDDIIFGSTNQDFCEEFGKMMANEFEMSMIGELSYFHYYKLIYHYRHFHCYSDRSDGVILAPSVGTIARPPRTETDSSDFYHRRVDDRCGSGIEVAFPSSHEKSGRLGYTFCPPALK